MPDHRPAFRSDIEGLRGVAILLVVLFHAGVSRLSGGFVGVDVFFVFSGFFITGPLVRELAGSGRIDLANFYLRRAQRLLPVLLVVLVATLAIVSLLYAPIDRAAIANTAKAVAFSAVSSGSRWRLTASPASSSKMAASRAFEIGLPSSSESDSCASPDSGSTPAIF